MHLKLYLKLDIFTAVDEVPEVSDVDECGNSDLNDCSPHAKCTNTDGYYTCTCKEGK